MQRSAPRLLRAVQQAGAATEASASALAPALTRQFGAPAGGHGSPTTPLSGIMPMVVSLPRKVVTTALSAVGNLVVGAATSGSAKGLVGNVADKLFVEEAAGSVADLDVAYWLTVFSKAGYTNAAGFKNAAAALKGKAASLSPEQVVGLVEAFHKANYADKELLAAFGANISANFSKYDTEGLLKVIAAFQSFGALTPELLDDIADSITYCNHYLAPTKACPGDLAAALTAYAKAGHERGDLFATLVRGFSEVSFAAMSDAGARKAAAVAALKALYDFQYFPEQIEALLYVAKSEGGLSGEEAALVDKVTAAAEDAAGGELQIYKENPDEDSTHWYGHHTHATTTSASLYCFRDSLVPTQYSPASMRPLK